MTCSAWSVTLSQAWPVSPASLISCPFVTAYATNFGRVRTTQLRLRRPAPTGFATAAFSPRPLALPEVMDPNSGAQDSKLSKNKSRNIALLGIATSVPYRFPWRLSKTTCRDEKIARVFAQSMGRFTQNSRGSRHSLTDLGYINGHKCCSILK